jgi:peroxiredoxin
MRYLSITILIILLSATTGDCRQVTFTIKGSVANAEKSKKLFLQGEFINITIPLGANGSFNYKGKMEESDFILVRTDNSFSWGIWICPGSIELQLEEYYLNETSKSGKRLLKVLSVKGPEETERGQYFIEYRNSLTKQFRPLPREQFRDSIDNNYFIKLKDYIQKHPSSRFSVHLIQTSDLNATFQDSLLNYLRQSGDQDKVQSIKQTILRDRLLAIGNTIENFKLPKLDGTVFSLNSLNDKYILLEFWASDCFPCRAVNPLLVKVYDEFHHKSFEIVGISLDKSKDAWKKAVEKDKLPWVQVSDLKGWDNEVSAKLLISSLPFNILIERSGKIIAKDLSPLELKAKLNEILAD